MVEPCSGRRGARAGRSGLSVAGRRSLALLAALLASAATASGCTNIGTAPSSAESTTTAPPHATLSTAPSPLGTILVTGTGRTLYDFSRDTSGASACTDVLCTILWPPLTVTGHPSVSGGAQDALVGVIQRPDGTSQVTYAGHPLYTYKEDLSPGMITGQAVRQSGGYWFVLSPSGQQIDTKPGSS
jgi:predicted lipoprotein with Yx(FWY)xxD motif